VPSVRRVGEVVVGGLGAEIMKLAHARASAGTRPPQSSNNHKRFPLGG